MTDGYRVVRASTLAWLLERHRTHADTGIEVPTEVARDLALAVVDLPAPVDEDRIRAAGPLLSPEEQEIYLLEELDLPRDRAGGQFWRLVVRVVHSMNRNEADAVLRIISGSSNDG